MECSVCKAECIGGTPCTNCTEVIESKAIVKKIGMFIAAAILFYWIGVVV